MGQTMDCHGLNVATHVKQDNHLTSYLNCQKENHCEVKVYVSYRNKSSTYCNTGEFPAAILQSTLSL